MTANVQQTPQPSPKPVECVCEILSENGFHPKMKDPTYTNSKPKHQQMEVFSTKQRKFAGVIHRCLTNDMCHTFRQVGNNLPLLTATLKDKCELHKWITV